MSEEEIKGNIDRRYERKYRTLNAKEPHGKIRTLYLDCEFCNKTTSLSPEEQVKIAKSFKNPLDFRIVECSCQRTQWILAKRNLAKNYSTFIE